MSDIAATKLGEAILGAGVIVGMGIAGGLAQNGILASDMHASGTVVHNTLFTVIVGLGTTVLTRLIYTDPCGCFEHKCHKCTKNHPHQEARVK